MKTVYVSHSSDFYYREELYMPLRESQLDTQFNLILPHEYTDNPYDTKNLFKTEKDLIVMAELSFPSPGRDMELGMAYIMDIPVIGISRESCTPSESQRLPCKKIIKYNSIEDILPALETCLSSN